MTPETVRDLALLNLEYRAVAGSWPERPGRDPVLHAAVREAAEAELDTEA